MLIARVIVLFSIVSAHLAMAFEAPAHFLSGTNGFMSMGLRNSSYAIDVPTNTLSNNPAFIAKEKQRRFSSSISLGNNVSYLKEATELSQGRADESSIQTLFQRHENNELQTQFELGHVQETFGWSITPFQVNYSTSFRNQALPEISLYAALEESAKVQFGSYIDNDWSYGIQLRYLHRRFVASRFYLMDAMLPDGNLLFEPKQQELFFVEPGILYAPKENDLNPEFTAVIVNAGIANKNYSEVPLNPEFHMTTSISPELNYGRYSLGIDINFDKRLSNGPGPLTLGGYYEFGILRIFGSLARYENAIGFGVFNTWWNFGVAHRNESYENSLGEILNQNKSYLFLGMEL